MKKILETLELKWTEYLLEIMVIVIGILVAYALNNWNEERKNTILEKEILVELSQNLNSNIDNINKNIAFQTMLTESIDLLLDHLENKKPYNDSLAYHFRNLLFLEGITFSQSAFETLKSIGFNTLQSSEIRMEVIQLFEIKYPEVNNLIRDVSMQRYSVTRSMFNKYFRTNREFMAVPVDYQALQQNQEFINWVYNRRAWKMGGVINNTEMLIEPTEALIKSVNEYLGE